MARLKAMAESPRRDGVALVGWTTADGKTAVAAAAAAYMPTYRRTVPVEFPT